MKRCPLCGKIWEVEKIFCPWDGNRLEAIAVSSPEVVATTSDAPKNLSTFEVFPETSVDENLLPGGSDFKKTEAQSLLDVALMAIQQKRIREQEQLRDQMKLFEEFNLYCRTLQYFVDSLKSQSDNFTYLVEHSDDVQELRFRYNLSFGDGRYRRTFPVSVNYSREPTREVSLEINLYEIGQDKDKRHFRTEKAGGRVDATIYGYRYLLTPPSKLDSAELVKWLETSFKSIFKLAYSD